MPEAIEVNITAETLRQFLAYAADAANWSGVPLVDGNVGFGTAGRGNLTQMKKAGLLLTTVEEGSTWIHFQDRGIALAKQNGIDI